MDPNQLIDYYARIRDASRRMHQLADSEQWDELIECELGRREEVSALRKALQESPDSNMHPDLLRMANDCILEILQLDQQTQSLAERWMSELGQDLQTVNTAQRLRRTYLTA